MLALALDLQLAVSARVASRTSIVWEGEGGEEVPLDDSNLIVRAAQEPFRGWSGPLAGLELRVRNAIPIGRGLGSSAAAIIAGLRVGTRLRGRRLDRLRMLELGLPLEGHADNLAAALFGGFCVAAPGPDALRVHRLDWPARWRAFVFVPDQLSPTAEARRLVPGHPARADVVFNLARVAEWVLAVGRADRHLVAGAMRDRLHQPARSQAYPYLDDLIAASLEAGALGAALSGAGGSVIAFADRNLRAIEAALRGAASLRGVRGRVLTLRAFAGR